MCLMRILAGGKKGYILIELIKRLKQTDRERGDNSSSYSDSLTVFLISVARARLEDESVSCILNLFNLSVAVDDP